MSRLFGLERDDRTSLMFGLRMNNNGTGLVLASLALSSYPNIMVPIISYNLIQHIVAGIVNEAMNKKASG
jgi:BASS family bile acid:Na+ symporter